MYVYIIIDNIYIYISHVCVCVCVCARARVSKDVTSTARHSVASFAVLTEISAELNESQRQLCTRC
jgi:hypothetical protein